MDFGFFVTLEEPYKGYDDEEVIGRYWTYGEASAKLTTEVSRIIGELGQAGYADDLKVITSISKDNVQFISNATGDLLAELNVDEREV